MTENRHKIKIEITEESFNFEYDGNSPSIVSEIVQKIKDTGLVAFVRHAMKNA